MFDTCKSAVWNAISSLRASVIFVMIVNIWTWWNMIHRRRAIVLITSIIISQSIHRFVPICVSISRIWNSFCSILQSILRAPLAAVLSCHRRFGLDQLRIGFAASKLLLPCFLWVEVVGFLVYVNDLFLCFAWFTASFFYCLFFTCIDRLKNIQTFIHFGIYPIRRFSCDRVTRFVMLLILLLKYTGGNWRLADVSVHGNSRAWSWFHLLFDVLCVLRSISFPEILAVSR